MLVTDGALVLPRDISDGLASGYVSPANQSTLYQAASLIPGVELLGDMRDQTGRHGTAVVLRDGRFTRVLVFEPVSGTFLEGATYETDDAGLLLPSPRTWTTVISRGIASEAGAPPKKG